VSEQNNNHLKEGPDSNPNHSKKEADPRAIGIPRLEKRESSGSEKIEEKKE